MRGKSQALFRKALNVVRFDASEGQSLEGQDADPLLLSKRGVKEVLDAQSGFGS